MTFDALILAIGIAAAAIGLWLLFQLLLGGKA